MCSVSAVSDHWRDNNMPKWFPNAGTIEAPVSRSEFNALRAELMALKAELQAAKAEDEANGNPDCEMEEKIGLLRELGKIMGVNFDEVFKNAS